MAALQKKNNWIFTKAGTQCPFAKATSTNTSYDFKTKMLSPKVYNKVVYGLTNA